MPIGRRTFFKTTVLAGLAAGIRAAFAMEPDRSISLSFEIPRVERWPNKFGLHIGGPRSGHYLQGPDAPKAIFEQTRPYEQPATGPGVVTFTIPAEVADQMVDHGDYGYALTADGDNWVGAGTVVSLGLFSVDKSGAVMVGSGQPPIWGNGIKRLLK